MGFKTFCITFFLLLYLSLTPLSAQSSVIRYDTRSDYKTGLSFFEASQYPVAATYLSRYLSTADSTDILFRPASFYEIASCLYADDPSAVGRMEQFIRLFPDDPHIQYAYYYLAETYYRRHDYPQALAWYERIRSAELRSVDRVPSLYRKAYCYRETGDKARAAQLFASITDDGSDYAEDALLYTAISDYEDRHFDQALNALQRLESNARFAMPASYYTALIYYEQGEYQRVIDYTYHLVVTDSTYAAEFYRLLAVTYGQLENYRSALAYWNAYEKAHPALPPTDRYEIGYVNYVQQQYTQSIPYFEQVAADSTDLGQYAAYHLADCYLKTSQKQKARAAFHQAAQMDYDPSVQEEAMFNDAVLTYELSYSPFNEIIRNFSAYLEKYPESPRTQAAYNYLVTAYGETKNYKMAYESLQKADLSLATVQRAYQRVAFFRGLELYNDREYDAAYDALTQSIRYGQYDRQMEARAYFWLAETRNREMQPAEAVTYYKHFLAEEQDVAAEKEYPLAFYGLGYSYFYLNLYDAAQTWFKQFIALTSENDPMWCDVHNRMGDCHFMKKEYTAAMRFYRQVCDRHGEDADYALFQCGFSSGLLGKQDEKIATLQDLIGQYPSSAYLDDALFELGKAYLTKGDVQSAIPCYRRVVTDFPMGSYYGKALSQLGLIYYNQNDTDAALRYYKQVVEQDPNSSDARSALIGIKTIYLDLNDVDTYVTYVSGLENHVDVTVSEQDSLTYAVAEKNYMQGNRHQAEELFRRYLDRFPHGAFTLHSHFYLAECLYQNQSLEQAMDHYKEVIGKPRSMFTEQTLNRLSLILYRQQQYSEALPYYRQLASVAEVSGNLTDARIGIMRCCFRTANYPETVLAAQDVLAISKLSPEFQREARYVLASAYDHLQDTGHALPLYREVAQEVGSAEGAESKYKIIEILYQQKKYKDAEKEVFDFVEKNTSHTFWMAKSFIVLAEVYIDTEDLFQASHTIQSVIDNYDVRDDGILREAEQVKARIAAAQHNRGEE